MLRRIKTVASECAIKTHSAQLVCVIHFDSLGEVLVTTTTTTMAKVFNRMVLPEYQQLRSPAVMRRATPATSRISAARVKRDLFGPVDKAESKMIFEREIAAHNKQASDKWGFNFQTGQPMENHTQYQWERVPPATAPVCFYGMVTLTPAAHVIPQATGSASENLLDERAERENCLILSPPAEVADTGDAESSSTKRTRSSSSSSSSPATKSANVQLKITDYLKERKRSSGGISKAPAAKKARSMHHPQSTTPQIGKSLSQ